MSRLPQLNLAGEMRGRMVQAVIFDLDGTLVDTSQDHIAAWKQALSESGVKKSHREIQREFGKTSDDIAQILLPSRIKRNARTVAERKDHLFLEMGYESAEAIPGARKTLSALKGKGMKIAVCSSNPRITVERLLKRFRLIRLVDVYVSMDEVRRGKPAPDILLLAARMMGLQPSSILVVGDSVYDMAAGKSAGMRTAGVASGASSFDQLEGEHPDFLLRDITQLIPLIDKRSYARKHSDSEVR